MTTETPFERRSISFRQSEGSFDLDGLAAHTAPLRCIMSVSSVSCPRGFSRAGNLFLQARKGRSSRPAPVDSSRAGETHFTLVSPQAVLWTCVLSLSRSLVISFV